MEMEQKTLEFGERKTRANAWQWDKNAGSTAKPLYSSRRISAYQVIIVDVVGVLILCWMVNVFGALLKLTDVGK